MMAARQFFLIGVLTIAMGLAGCSPGPTAPAGTTRAPSKAAPTEDVELPDPFAHLPSDVELDKTTQDEI